jgi:hypothetical protein
MSLSYQKLTPVLVTDPVTDVTDVNSYAVLQGGSKISWKAFTSTAIAASSIQFTACPPSANVITDRAIRATIPIRLTFNGTITTSNGSYAPVTSLLNAGLDAPRFLPLAGSLETLQVNINNDSISIPMSDVIHPLTRYNINEHLRTHEYSTSLSYPDQSFNYADLVGTNRNPLANYGDSIDGTAIPRGGYPFTVVSNPGVTATTGGVATTAVVDLYVTEYLYLSPMYWGCATNDCQGFYNVNSMDLNLNFLGQAGFRMWSHCPLVSTSGAITVTSNITSISVQFNGFTSPAFSYPQNFPQMLFKYLTPNILTKEILSPTKAITWPYFNVQRYPTDIGAVSYGMSPTPLSSNNIQLSSIPRRIYIFARPTNAVLQSRCDLTDCYLVLNNVSVQWANQNTLLSSASQVQLYDINVKNHSSQSWSSWSGLGLNNSAFPPSVNADMYGGVGSILCLEMGTDIQLDGDEAPGLSGQYQLQVQAYMQNLNSSGAWDNIPMTLYIITISEGTFTIPGIGSAQHQDAPLSKGDILDSQSQPGVNYRKVQSLNGGDFLSSLRDFGNTINDFLKRTKIISTVSGLIPHPIAQGISSAARNLGYGDDEGGVAIQGGRRMTKAELQSRL